MTGGGETSPIRIAGAGLAGLACAITLARGGRAVELYERQAAVGARFHSDFQILENYTQTANVLDEFQDMGLTTDFFQHPGYHVDFYDYRLRCYRMASREPFGYYIQRGPAEETLDSALRRQAETVGVRLLLGRSLDVDRADVRADGGVHPSGIAKEMVFHTDLPDTFRTLLDHRCTPRGFAYLFVINGLATIGATILADFKNMNRYFHLVVERFQEVQSFTVVDPHESGAFVQFFLADTARIGHQYLVGERAGFQEYLFGLGIRRVIASGYLAAHSILTGEDYDTLWKERFGYQMPVSIVNRVLFELGGNIGASLFMRLGHRMDFRTLGYRLNQPDPLRSMLWPVVRRLCRYRGEDRYGETCVWSRAPADT